MNESLHVVQIVALGDELVDTFCLLSIQAVVVGEARWTGEHRLGWVLHVLVIRAVIVIRVHERLILGLWRDSVIVSPTHMTRSSRHGLRLTIRPLEKTLLLVEAGMGPVGAIHWELAGLVAVGLVHGILARVGCLIGERRTSCWLEMAPRLIMDHLVVWMTMHIWTFWIKVRRTLVMAL